MRNITLLIQSTLSSLFFQQLVDPVRGDPRADGGHPVLQCDRPGPRLLGRDALWQDGQLVHQPDVLLRCAPTAGQDADRAFRVFDRVRWEVPVRQAGGQVQRDALRGDADCECYYE